MYNVDIVPFHPDHVPMLKLRREVGGRFFENYDTWAKSITEIGKNNPTFTGFIGDKMIGFGGVSMIWTGVGEAWVCFDESMQHKPKVILYYTKYMLDMIIKQNNLHRVQATCRIDFPQAASFLEHIGFELESVLHKFSEDGVDHFMYSMLPTKGAV